MKKNLILLLLGITYLTVSFLYPIDTVSNGNNNALWMRYPAISPDGANIVFSYKGNLYKVKSAGGVAVPLTISKAYDFKPVWSRDGLTIAFASNRFGNFDVFTMSSEGGKVKRITYHSADDFPTDFSVDNKSILFTSSRMDSALNIQFPRASFSELYSISVLGGREKRISTIPMEGARYNENGTKILYHDRKGIESIWRKHHTSSATRNIGLYDLKTKKYVEIIDYIGEDLNPVFSGNYKGFYFLSERSGGSYNIFKTTSLSKDAKNNVKRITRFKNHPIRFLSVSNNDKLCFTYGGRLYTKEQKQKAKELKVYINNDSVNDDIENYKVYSGATEIAVSPNEREIAFIVRGDIFVTSTKSNLTRQITNTVEEEKNISFSKNGKILLYASERSGTWNIYKTKIVRKNEKYFFDSTLLKEYVVLKSDKDTYQPTFSPNEREVAFIEDTTTLKVLNIKTGKVKLILSGDKNFSYVDGDQYYKWSPDGKWFLVQFLKDEHYSTEVGIIDASGNRAIYNLSESGYEDLSPKWMNKGNMIIWFSGRDGMRNYATVDRKQLDVYAVFTNQNSFDRFNLSKEEYELLTNEEKKEKKKKDKKDEKSKKNKKTKKQKSIKPINIEFDNMRTRKARLTINSSILSDAVVSNDGKYLLYLSKFEKGYDLWRTNLRTRATKILAKLNGGSSKIYLGKKGKYVYMLLRGRILRVDIKSGKKKNINFKSEKIIDKTLERDYLFVHVWTQIKRRFYNKKLHNVNWKMMRIFYRRFIPHINNSIDFAEMLSEMLGELNVSHTGARRINRNRDGDNTASLGVFYDTEYKGDGLKILEIIEGSPLKTKKSKIKSGTIIEKINGVKILKNKNYYSLFNRKSGKNILLSLYAPPNNSKYNSKYNSKHKDRWEERVKPISRRAESRLLYKRWIKRNRALTDKLSNGRLGYVHVSSMSDSSYRTVIEEVLGKYVNKEAIIIDTRFNGGGDLVDDLTNFLSGKRYMDFIPPNNKVIGFEPQMRWTKPSIVIASEGNYSDAHCFAWAYKKMGLGKVIGMPVAGTCTFVWWETLMNKNVFFGIPNMGIKDDGGNYLENCQLEPDIKIDNTPEDLVKGKDRQLETAIKILLKDIDKGGKND